MIICNILFLFEMYFIGLFFFEVGGFYIKVIVVKFEVNVYLVKLLYWVEVI